MVAEYSGDLKLREDIVSVFKQVISEDIDLEILGNDDKLYEHARNNSTMHIKQPYGETFFKFILSTQFMLFRHIPTTARHIFDVYHMGNLIADDILKLSKEKVDDIKFALIIHDLGKIATPREVLEKPGRFTIGE
jgi:HD-GYP domain-containing protein (c-di-GMP phosphodiesterase class II)